MKQELKEIVDELNECFEYACTKATRDSNDVKAKHRVEFILDVISSLYLDAVNRNNSEVKYEMCLKCKSCEEK